MNRRIRMKEWAPVMLKITAYLLLTGLAFVFVYPLLSMVVDSFKSYTDISNSTVKWVPREPTVSNFTLAWVALNAARTGVNSVMVSVVATAGHVLSCSIVAYGFARFRFPFRSALFAVVILSFLIPVQTIIIPTYITYTNLHIADSFVPILMPTFLGFGLRGGIFIFLFRQYFLRVPKSLEEAASIDGCGPFQTFFRVVLPSAGATMVVSVLLSLIWHWNDSYEPAIYLSTYDQFLMPQMLAMLSDQLANMQTSAVQSAGAESQFIYHRGVVMAATLICLIPPFVLYSGMQRKFVAGIERSGLVE